MFHFRIKEVFKLDEADERRFIGFNKTDKSVFLTLEVLEKSYRIYYKGKLREDFHNFRFVFNDKVLEPIRALSSKNQHVLIEYLPKSWGVFDEDELFIHAVTTVSLPYYYSSFRTTLSEIEPDYFKNMEFMYRNINHVINWAKVYNHVTLMIVESSTTLWEFMDILIINSLSFVKVEPLNALAIALVNRCIDAQSMILKLSQSRLKRREIYSILEKVLETLGYENDSEHAKRVRKYVKAKLYSKQLLKRLQAA